MVFQNNVLSGAGGSGTAVYQIDQSIRFNDDDSAYMYRNVDAPAFGNKYTMSFWAKFTNSDDYRRIITFRDKRGSGYPFGFLRLEKSDDSSSFQLTIFEYDTAISSNYPVYVVSAMKFRDYAAWYHIVVSVDYTRPVADRCRLYVNGTQQTFSFNGNSASSGTPQSQASGSGANYWQIGRLYGLTSYPGDYYLAEIHVIDGNAYGPEFFGETNSSGIWIPKEFTGSHGSGGFFIDGRDASDLGDDESGNGNDFTTSGLAAHDQVSDTPTNNFNTINPLNPLSDGTLSQGNLKNVLSGNDQFYTTQELGIKSYCEVRVDALSNYGGTLGLGTFGGDDDDNSLVFQTNYSSGYIYLNGGNASANIGGTVSAGDIVMMAYDPTTRKWWVGVNGTWRNSGDPANGTGQVYQHSTTDFGDGIGAIVWGGWKGSANGLTVTWNFGQEGTFGGQETAGGNSDGNGIGNFKYSVPSGFLALCTKNLGS